MNAPTEINETHRVQFPQLDVPPRLLLGPGPSNAHPRVLQALTMRQVGHLDPCFIQLMNEIQTLLRYAWQTDNPLTIPVSGAGSAAMEATLANTVEPGDVVLVGVKGYFGHRLVDMAGRYGADVRKMMKPWGQVFSLEEIRENLETHRPAILALVHAETSTGARQPLEDVGELCREYNCLLLVDTVTSLGGVPLFLDRWGVDMAYSCSQKGLGCPPGISPLTLSPRAVEKLHRRKTTVPNWYLDMSLVSKYWGDERTYHHTAPINMSYALREALRLVAEEGLAERWQRHQDNVELLWQGLEDLGLTCHVEKEYRLPTLTTVRIPEGVDGKAVARQLLDEYNIEIAGGLGELGGKVWRIGLMGFNSRRENVVVLLEALDRVLQKHQAK
ncbi:alanine--glyoxylate aminotransferase family protein [Lusitaniella coriacea LEGE 07157]|uniref:Alanine--glyoxylate aminotransferase family protein n=1 Tax=Lusitaniella coriacea LEGE 07157 TaxID=945747 RepID=A0A8J7AWP8_9CYAN|nr:alanine--glyoxylate aminotransferase family protein [Lusitaniella coriacea]MBE9114852.1 alanine--glyoxylate aminotransferase family protein [Lusitaniella coriacea LEGE 07157]